MHQQVRTSIRKSRIDGKGGRDNDDSLVEILTLLKGVNLRSACRVNLDNGGGEEFVFSVDHPDGDDKADLNARNILRAKHHKADAYRVEPVDVDHREGALLEQIQRLKDKLGESVVEVHVLAGEGKEPGTVTVQLVTGPMLERPLE
jgi:hypothetical protein